LTIIWECIIINIVVGKHQHKKEGSDKMSYAKIKGKIKELYGTQNAFAEAIGMDNATLSAKLNNKSSWKDEEIEKACGLLNIPIEQVHEYFFCRESWENTTK
jgi:transcriptional regulator with XRE-family HTH domain